MVRLQAHRAIENSVREILIDWKSTSEGVVLGLIELSLVRLDIRARQEAFVVAPDLALLDARVRDVVVDVLPFLALDIFIFLTLPI